MSVAAKMGPARKASMLESKIRNPKSKIAPQFALLAFLALAARWSMAVPAPSYRAKLERTQYKGWNVYRLTNGIISLLVAPDIGGRAIQLQLGEQEYFSATPDLAGEVLPPEENNVKAGWANYGGDKVWPAPEGWASDNEWPSIPYYVLDGSRFKSEVVTYTPAEAGVRVTGHPGARTGVHFGR